LKTATISSSKREVFDAVKKASLRLGLIVDGADLTKGKIRIKQEGSFLSFGNEVTVTISSKIDKTVMKVASESSAPIQIIDWGVNGNLESKIIREVKNILSR
jgi:hypothetical protein